MRRPRAGDRERAHASATDMFEDRRNGREGEVHLAGEQIDHRRPSAAIGNVVDLDLRDLPKLLAGEMDRGAQSGRRKGHLAGLLPGERDQFLGALGRHVRMHHQQQRRHREQRHGGEILPGVVRQLAGEQAGIDHERAVDHADGVAVRRRRRDRLRADLARAAAAIVDHERLPERAFEMRLHQPRQDVGRAARRIRHDHAHRALRIILRRRDARECRERKACQDASPVQHRGSHSLKFASRSSSGSGPRPGMSGICTAPFSIGTLLPYGT